MSSQQPALSQVASDNLPAGIPLDKQLLDVRAQIQVSDQCSCVLLILMARIMQAVSTQLAEIQNVLKEPERNWNDLSSFDQLNLHKNDPQQWLAALQQKETALQQKETALQQKETALQQEKTTLLQIQLERERNVNQGGKCLHSLFELLLITV
jgi:hypothetical protein